MRGDNEKLPAEIHQELIALLLKWLSWSRVCCWSLMIWVWALKPTLKVRRRNHLHSCLLNTRHWGKCTNACTHACTCTHIHTHLQNKFKILKNWRIHKKLAVWTISCLSGLQYLCYFSDPKASGIYQLVVPWIGKYIKIKDMFSWLLFGEWRPIGAWPQISWSIPK